MLMMKSLKNDAKCFTVIADNTSDMSDISSIEQFSSSVRHIESIYVNNLKTVEKFLKFYK